MIVKRLPTRKEMIYPLILSMAFTIIAAVVCIVYTGYVDRQSNQRWCNAVVAIDDAFRQTNAPTSSAGKRIAEAYSELRVQFSC